MVCCIETKRTERLHGTGPIPELCGYAKEAQIENSIYPSFAARLD